MQTVHRISGLLLRLLDITPASSLSFVLDTTGSMGEETNAAKIQARHIVEQRRGTPMEPTQYVLVPFHDPGNYGLARRVEASPGQEVMSLVGKWASWLHFHNRMEALPRILVLYWHLYAYSIEGNGTPLQYSCLENPMDGGAGRLQSMGS